MSNLKRDSLGCDESDLAFLGFALSDCTVELDPQSAKYLRPVNRTALELATHNRFGSDIGGFWLMHHQIAQLRNLPSYYPGTEAPLVARAVEAYLRAQLHDFYRIVNKNSEVTIL